MPKHVTGVLVEGAGGRYFDPNGGIASFASKDNLFNFISDYHGSAEFNQAYSAAVGDTFVVQMVRA
jgi:hypothetical protein